MNGNEYDHIKYYVKNNVGDEETQLLISDFAILWNEYEDELYKREHHIKDIPRVIKKLKFEKYEKEINELYKRLKTYISNKMHFNYDDLVRNYNILIKKPRIINGEIKRYSDGSVVYTGEISKRNLEVLIESNKLDEKLNFMLLIIARVRNNMFHGSKEISLLKYQKELFKVSNETLKLVLDMEKKPFNNN